MTQRQRAIERANRTQREMDRARATTAKLEAKHHKACLALVRLDSARSR